MTCSRTSGAILMVVTLAWSSSCRREQPVVVELVLDASGSMAPLVDPGDPAAVAVASFFGIPVGEGNIDVAKRELERHLASLPSGSRVALRRTGGNDVPDRPCEDTKLLVDFSAANRTDLLAQAKASEAVGSRSPLLFALERTREDLARESGPKRVYLFSDGADNCGGDLCSFAGRLRDDGVIVHVFGIGTTDPQLGCLATLTGGEFLNLTSPSSLEQLARLPTKEPIPRLLVWLLFLGGLLLLFVVFVLLLFGTLNRSRSWPARRANLTSWGLFLLSGAVWGAIVFGGVGGHVASIWLWLGVGLTAVCGLAVLGAGLLGTDPS